MTDFPERVTIETTSICNLNCEMCYTKGVKKGIMEEWMFSRLLKECDSHNVKTIVPFFRGEPFCDPNFIDRISLIRETMPDVRIELSTNATLIGIEDVEAMVRIGVDFLSISVDTGDRMLSSFDNRWVTNVINHFIEAKTDMFLQVSTVDVGQGDSKLSTFHDVWDNLVDSVKVYERHTVDGIHGHTNNKRESRKVCSKIYSDIVVYYDGTVGLCCYDFDRSPSEIGSVYYMTIESLWQSRSYREIRKQHETCSITDRVCRDCDMWRP